jgi:hypothetical protein
LATRRQQSNGSGQGCRDRAAAPERALPDAAPPQAPKDTLLDRRNVGFATGSGHSLQALPHLAKLPVLPLRFGIVGQPLPDLPALGWRYFAVQIGAQKLVAIAGLVIHGCL